MSVSVPAYTGGILQFEQGGCRTILRVEQGGGEVWIDGHRTEALASEEYFTGETTE